jgi:ABC-type nickel/cobalt efflux system permease component RcnA
MARRLLFMLITLLALQFSWSVVAGYCAHETGRAAQHWGHHPDTNAADELASAPAEHPADTQKSTAHAHCASCAHGTLSVPGMEIAAPARVTEQAPESVDIILASHDTAPPERPQWRAAA